MTYALRLWQSPVTVISRRKSEGVAQGGDLVSGQQNRRVGSKEKQPPGLCNGSPIRLLNLRVALKLHLKWAPCFLAVSLHPPRPLTPLLPVSPFSCFPLRGPQRSFAILHHYSASAGLCLISLAQFLPLNVTGGCRLASVPMTFQSAPLAGPLVGLALASLQ